MDNNVDYLPIWKKNASAAERLEELALVARKHPERFMKFCLVYADIDTKGGTQIRSFEHGCSSVIEAYGLYQLAQFEYFKESRLK